MASPINVATGTSDVTAFTSRREGASVRLFGFQIRETAGAAATGSIRQGSVSGEKIMSFSLAANGMVDKWFGPQGIECEGIYLERATGDTEATFYVG